MNGTQGTKFETTNHKWDCTHYGYGSGTTTLYQKTSKATGKRDVVGYWEWRKAWDERITLSRTYKN